jgi:hypothetical protein
MNTPTKIILVVSAVILVLILAIVLGVMDFLADDSAVGTAAIESLVTYWVLICLAVLLVAAIRTKPLELTLTVISLLLVLVLAEAAVRIISFDRAKTPFCGLRSKTFHHIYPANAEMFMGVFEGQSVLARTNEDGLRTDYSREEFLKYKNRVVLLGDSFLLGLGVRQEKLCSQIAEDVLRERLGQDDIAVLNAGLVSYSPLLSGQLFRHKLAAYKPTVVLLLLDVSDIGDDMKYEYEAVRDGDDISFDLNDEKDSKLYCALYEIARPVMERLGKNITYPYYALIHSGTFSYDYYEFDLNIDGVAETNRFFIYRHPLEKTRAYFEKTLANINELAGQVRRAGARFVLVVTPRHQHWSNKECPENWEMKQYQYRLDDPYKYEYFRFFREVEDSLDYDVYQLLPAFQRTTEFPLVFNTDPHWNQRGHAFVGRLLADYMVKYNFIQ